MTKAKSNYDEVQEKVEETSSSASKNVQKAIVNVERLNLRKAASMNADVLIILNNGEVLEVLEHRNEWDKVHYPKLALDGYVLRQFIREV